MATDERRLTIAEALREAIFSDNARSFYNLDG